MRETVEGDPNPPATPNIWTYGDVTGDGATAGLLAGVLEGNANIAPGFWYVECTINHVAGLAGFSVGNVNWYPGRVGLENTTGTFTAVLRVESTENGRLFVRGLSESTFSCINVRDSQNIPSLVSGFTLYNWLCEFYETVQVSDVPPITAPNIWTYGDAVGDGESQAILAGVQTGDPNLTTGI